MTAAVEPVPSSASPDVPKGPSAVPGGVPCDSARSDAASYEQQKQTLEMVLSAKIAATGGESPAKPGSTAPPSPAPPAAAASNGNGHVGTPSTLATSSRAQQASTSSTSAPSTTAAGMQPSAPSAAPAPPTPPMPDAHAAQAAPAMPAAPSRAAASPPPTREAAHAAPASPPPAAPKPAATPATPATPAPKPAAPTEIAPVATPAASPTAATPAPAAAPATPASKPLQTPASALQTPAAASPPSVMYTPGAPPAVSPPVKPKAPPATAVVSAAVGDVSAAARAGVAAGKALLAACRKKQQPVNVTLDQLLHALFCCTLLGVALLVTLLAPPSPLAFAASLGAGVAAGLGLSFMYYSNLVEKQETNRALGIQLGIKGMQFLVGHLPSWLNFTEKEKIEWLNSIMVEVWPFVDRAVCKMVKQQVEQICADTIRTQKVPIKRIGFKQLTFGDAPFRVEGMYVTEHSEHGLEMEVDVRWCGDANITLAVEVAGESTKMCPQVTDITFVATMKVRLAPLVDKIPGFGGIMLCMTKPPRIGYNMNMGAALGGSVVANVVKPFIQNIVNNQIINMLVWPQRLVIPVPLPELLADEQIQAGVQKMVLRDRGVLKVVVKAAEGLPAADISLTGKASSDPYVVISTDGKHEVKTKIIKKNLNPVWDQTFFVLVQEPTNQAMQVTVFDHDFSGGPDILGRCLVKLAPVCAKEMTEVVNWSYLGPGSWSDPAGCGKGNGRVQLAMTYKDMESYLPNEPKDATMGILIVRLLKCSNMGFGKRLVKLYCEVDCNGEKWESGVSSAKDGADHLFVYNNIKAFYDVRFDVDVRISVIERGLADEEVGMMELPITDVAEAQDYNPLAGHTVPGFMQRTIKLDESDGGLLTLSLQYAAHF